MKNILLLNAGTRNTLVRYFKKSLNGSAKVIATDSYELAPALYEADNCYVTKRWDTDGYWSEIEEICMKENVGLIVSLVDPELELLAAEKNRFQRMGILLNSSDEQTIRDTFDKYQTLEFVRKHNYPWIKSFVTFESALSAIEEGTLYFPLIMKPRKGSGSAGVEVIHSIDRMKELFANHKDMLAQEYMGGYEIGADVFVDLLSGELVSIFTKRKLKMRSGETDKSVSFKDETLFSMLAEFVKEFNLRGANDIDLFEKDGKYYISEINPRFGGGYLHAYAAGVDFPKYLMNNMNGILNEPAIGKYDEGIYMMKYFDVKIMREEDISK